MTIVGARLAGRFDVRARVGEMPGYVELRALDVEADTEVALWCIEPGLHGMVARDLLFGEIAKLRALKHKGLRRLLALGDDGPTLWAVYPLAEPGPQPRAGSTMPVDQVAAWVKAVAGGLDAAHVAGWCHGRLVPNDVSLLRGNLVIGGVGLWHDIEPAPAAAAWRSLEQFIAPEVRDGAPPTAAADAWSLAACAAALLVGAPDGGRDLERAVAERHPALAKALAGALTAEPERRCSVRDLALRIADAAKRPSPPRAEVVPVEMTTSGTLRAVSMRPGGEAAPRPITGDAVPEPGEIDDTQRRARIRPIADTVGRGFATAPGALGYMAPPRDQVAAPRRGRTIAIATAVIVVVGVVAAFVVVAMDRGASPRRPVAATANDAPPAVAAVDAASLVIDDAAARACSATMPVVGSICIDAYESPGTGRLPDTGVTVAEAAAACGARGLRLCAAAEWRAACAGPGAAPWPYGSAFEQGACNAGTRGMVAKVGAFERCVSASGAYDLAGHVAEWLADGTIAGGSAVDGGDGRCAAPVRPAAPGARFADVGFRCCGDR